MTRGFARILVPTDFSPPSDAALATAKELAARLRASIHLVHILEDPSAFAAYATEAYGYMPQGMKESWQREAVRHLDAQLTAEDRAQFRATTHVFFGSPAASIVEHARDNNMDLIVMGTHGRGGVAHLLLGSVTERVVRTADCPVLTMRGTAPARATVYSLAEGDYSTFERPNFSIR
jgi:nucleotide-binding universal stress UspA family protein